MRNCKVTWYKNDIGDYWRSITFDLADALEDQMSALADASSAADLSSCGGSGKQWCAHGGGWKSFEPLLNGRAPQVDTRLGWGKSYDGITGNWVKVTATTPSGY